MNPYTTMWTGPHAGDGPQNVHVVLVDNGRTNALADELGRQALRCIRCSACLNVCPVYERVGGHAYGSVYSGPIGAVLTPQLRGRTEPIDASLPYASSLCGACFDVCPVRIEIPDLLVHLRRKVVDEHKRHGIGLERLSMAAVGAVMANPHTLRLAQWGTTLAGRLPLDHLGKLPGPGAAAWTSSRDLPLPAPETFTQWWAKRQASRPKTGTNGAQEQS